MGALDYAKATAFLTDAFTAAEAAFRDAHTPALDASLATAADSLFTSSTQSYREVLLGCCIARWVDPTLNIRLPYVNQGERAFNGRTLDEKVINPFLQDRAIPCSKGPYLATFRRSVRFTVETATGLRDKVGYQALLTWLTALEAANPREVQRLTQAFAASLHPPARGGARALGADRPAEP